MKIICINNTGINIPKQFYEFGGWSKDMIFDALSIGKSYVVYAVFTIKENNCFLICNDFYDGESYKHPMFYPSSLFETIDNTNSQYWIMNEVESAILQTKVNNIGFPEIINEEYFYGNLVEGYAREESIFSYYKSLIDNENSCW